MRGTHLCVAALAFACALALACGGGGRPPDLPPPPSGLVYAENPAIYTLSVPVFGNAPSTAGGPVSAFSVEPRLPAGLSLNERTGVISGLPTALSAAAKYTIVARNAAGQTSTELILSVNDLPPAELTYASSAGVYTKGLAITPNAPSHAGGAIASYEVHPWLPPGLSLSPSGTISGTPLALAAEAEYTITATNPYGHATTTITITVNGNPPRNLRYSSNPAVYVKGVSIVPNVPSAEGGAVGRYEADALPPGLHYDATTGAIYGTPTEVSPQTSYRVTAFNEDGSAAVDVQLMVKEIDCTADAASVATSPGQTQSVRFTCTAVGPYWVEYPGVPSGATVAEVGASPIDGTPLWAHAGSASWTVTFDPGTATVGDYPVTVNLWRSTLRDQGAPGPALSWGVAPPIELIVVAGGVLDPISLQ